MLKRLALLGAGVLLASLAPPLPALAEPSDEAQIAYVRGESYTSVIQTVYPGESEYEAQDPAPGFDTSFMHSPDWHPNGELIAFGTAYNNDIYIMDVSGAEAQLIRQLNTGGDDPRWSPSGELMTFNKTVENSDGDGSNSQVLVASALDGSGMTQLTSGAGPNDNDVGDVHSQQAYTPDFSRDGSTVFFGRQFITVACCTPTELNYGVTTYQLASVPTGGGEITILQSLTDDEATDGGSFRNPDVSPDGRYLAYDHHDGEDRWVYVRDLMTGDIERLVLGSDPSFSPDGTRLAYSSDTNVMAVDLDDGQIVNVTQPTEQCQSEFFCGSAAWQPLDPHERAVALSEAKGDLKGKVTSDLGLCTKNVAVKIQRKTSKGWKTIATKETDGKGRFGHAVKPGKYRAVAPEVVKDATLCLKARSGNVKAT